MKHQISEPEAVEIVKRANQPHAWAFDREIFDALLKQRGATGIRVYLGRNAKGDDCPVVVAIDGEGGDLMGIIAEEATPCPPFCADSSLTL
jgi:hypothetical protein